MDMMADGANFSLKEEIRDYWSGRAATFDDSPSHKIDDRYGMPEWHRLLRQAFGVGPDRTLDGLKALDIACGTGEISRMLCGFGAEVTAIDFSETMLGRARAKLAGQSWTGILSDAEALQLLEDDSFDIAVTRHLVWTLTDPLAAFRDWRRVLKPGGQLLVVDGDWTARKNWMHRLRHWLAARLDGGAPRGDGQDRARHEAILKQLYYREGLTADMLRTDLMAAGFTQFRTLPVRRLYGAGMRNASLASRLRLSGAHRFALVAG